MCGTRFFPLYTNYGPFKHVTQKVESYGEVFITLNPSKPIDMRVKEQLMGALWTNVEGFCCIKQEVCYKPLSLEQQKERGKNKSFDSKMQCLH
jgi:hypothetical protein